MNNATSTPDPADRTRPARWRTKTGWMVTAGVVVTSTTVVTPRLLAVPGGMEEDQSTLATAVLAGWLIVWAGFLLVWRWVHLREGCPVPWRSKVRVGVIAVVGAALPPAALLFELKWYLVVLTAVASGLTLHDSSQTASGND